MIKKNLKIIIITSIVILLPVVAGLLLWNLLPEQLPTHWNANGEIDRWSSKPFVVFGLPLLMLFLHLLCMFGTCADPKRENHAKKILHLVFWITPVISLLMLSVTYMTALEIPVRMEVILLLLMGLIFIILGNYLPKCKQNYTIGIKLPWTLDSEENWNRTHRLAGRLWMLGGIALLLISFLGHFYLFIAIFLVMALVPVVYSYVLHRKGI